jgi:MFS family permease
MILIICSLYSFLSNSALLGPSVYIVPWAESFKISPVVASGLISYPNICYGIGTLITVPMYLKFGRRPVMLLSLLVYLAGLIGCGCSSSFGGLMAARVIHALASGVCEALPVQLVNDIFFRKFVTYRSAAAPSNTILVHERGNKLGYYTVCLCWGSTGPLYAGYMLAGGYSWRLFFYVETAFAGLLLILGFLFVEETTYKRVSPNGPTSPNPTGEKRVFGQDELDKSEETVAHVEVETMVPPRRNFVQTLNPWSGINHDEEFFMTSIRSFTYFLVPAVLWVVTSYGIYIGLGALVFNYTFPIKIVAPPYNWSQENAGLIALGNLIGYGLAIPLVWSSDRLAAYLTKRNGGIREAEMRLGVLIPVSDLRFGWQYVRVTDMWAGMLHRSGRLDRLRLYCAREPAMGGLLRRRRHVRLGLLLLLHLHPRLRRRQLHCQHVRDADRHVRGQADDQLRIRPLPLRLGSGTWLCHDCRGRVLRSAHGEQLVCVRIHVFRQEDPDLLRRHVVGEAASADSEAGHDPLSVSCETASYIPTTFALESVDCSLRKR